MNNHALSIVKAIALLLAAASLAALSLWFRPINVQGSTFVGSEYQATTTAASIAVPIRYVKTGWGSLGSVVVTGANTGKLYLYNATTSNVTLRGGKATTSILLAEMPASVAAGTYTFDVEFTDGLMVVTEGSAPTSTITWR